MELVRGIEQLVNKAKENTKAYVRSEEEEKKEKAKAAAPAAAGERKKKMEELKKEYLDKVDFLKGWNYPIETEQAFVQDYAKRVGERYAALFKQRKAEHAKRLAEAEKAYQHSNEMWRLKEDNLGAARSPYVGEWRRNRRTCKALSRRSTSWPFGCGPRWTTREYGLSTCLITIRLW